MPNPIRDPREADRGHQQEGERDPTFEQTTYGADPWADTRVRDPRDPNRDPAADDRLREAIAAALDADPRPDIRDLEVSARNGDVTLRGTAATTEDAAQANRAVGAVPGVRRVVNLLQVRSS